MSLTRLWTFWSMQTLKLGRHVSRFTGLLSSCSSAPSEGDTAHRPPMLLLRWRWKKFPEAWHLRAFAWDLLGESLSPPLARDREAAPCRQGVGWYPLSTHHHIGISFRGAAGVERFWDTEVRGLVLSFLARHEGYGNSSGSSCRCAVAGAFSAGRNATGTIRKVRPIGEGRSRGAIRRRWVKEKLNAQVPAA